MNEETVVTDQAAPLNGKSRVSDACQGLLTRLQKELEAEEDEDYWKVKFGLSSSAKPFPPETIVEVDNENRESREENVQGRSTVLDEPTEDRTETAIERSDVMDANAPEPPVERPEQQTPLSSYFPEQSKKNLASEAEQCEDASVASSKRSTGSIHSVVSRALSVTSKQSIANSRSYEPASEIEPPQRSTHQEEAETLTYNAPIALDEETVDTTKLKQKQKRKSLMKSILKTLKTIKKEKKEKKKANALSLAEDIPVGEIVVESRDVDPIVPVTTETLTTKPDSLPMVNDATETLEEKSVMEGEQREEEKNLSLSEALPEEEHSVLQPIESPHTSVHTDLDGPASCAKVEGTLDASRSTESVVQDSPVDLKALFQDASMASAESSEAPPTKAEERDQALTTASSHDSIERHRQKLLSKLSTMENILQMSRSRSEDSSIVSSKDIPENSPRNPSKDAPTKGFQLPWFSLGASARNLLAAETLDKDDAHEARVLPGQDDTQEPTARMHITDTDNEATETLDGNTPSESISTKRLEATEGCIEPTILNKHVVAVMEGTDCTLTKAPQEKTETSAETHMAVDSAVAEAVAGKEEETPAEKVASVGKRVEVEPLAVEPQEISKESIITEVEESNGPVEAADAQPMPAESEIGTKVEKKKIKVKKIKTKKIKKTKKTKKKGKALKNETEEGSKNETKEETRKEKLEKLKFKLVEKKRIIKAMSKMKASATDPVIVSKIEPADAQADAENTYLDAISEVVASTNHPVESLETEGGFADKKNKAEEETNLSQQAEYLPELEDNSACSPPVEPVLTSIVKSRSNPRKAPKKMLSWSEDVRDNYESPDEFEIVDKLEDSAPSKPGDSDEVEAVIWWSASKEAVEVMCELEDEEEKSVQSAQSSHGDSTYNTLETDPTFALEPDFSYSNFRTVTGEIFEEAFLIGEELTAVGQRLLPTPEIPEIPGIGSFTSWFSAGTGKDADDTEGSKKKKKKKKKSL